MATRRPDPLPRPRKADLLGRFKADRHGTRHWTTWLTEPRAAPPAAFQHGKRHLRRPPR